MSRTWTGAVLFKHGTVGTELRCKARMYPREFPVLFIWLQKEWERQEKQCLLPGGYSVRVLVTSQIPFPMEVTARDASQLSKGDNTALVIFVVQSPCCHK